MAANEDTSSRSYGLPRHAEESARLDIQHKVYSSAAGFLVHPTIEATLPATPRVIEVATGTGVWILDLASKRPSSWSFTGTDISDAQYTRSISRAPSNVSFRTLNILDPIPEDLQGSFDVVHMRHLAIAFTGEQFITAARHALSLLKPGGWIQWQDVHVPSTRIIQLVPGASIAHNVTLLDAAINITLRYGKIGDFVPRLSETLTQVGFEACWTDTFSTDRDPATRLMNTDTHSRAVYSTMKHTAMTDPESEWTVEQVDESWARCREELKDGKIYYRSETVIVTGRRPAA